MTHELVSYEPLIAQEPIAVTGPARVEEGKVLIPLDTLSGIIAQSDALIQSDRINASSAQGQFPGIFGRDSIITAEAKIASHQLSPNGQIDKITPPILALHRLIATYDLPIAGIHSGDLVHETRTIQEGYPQDWFVAGDRGLNYDELDGPDRLINLDHELIGYRPDLHSQLVESIELMVARGIRNAREYEGAAYIRAGEEPGRLFPGITDKRWRDGQASTVSDDLSSPPHPIRPVEEQALRWSALLHGADLVENRNPRLALEARETAAYVQEQFLRNFIYQDARGMFIADAIDARGRKIHAITIDQIFVLLHDYQGRTILDSPQLQQAVVQRSFDELYDCKGGFRTVSENSPVHPNNKYQGPKSRWPHACAMAVQAINAEAKRTRDPQIRAELLREAILLGEATLDPIFYFGSPIEASLVTGDGRYTLEYDKTPEGISKQYSRVQSWSGAGAEYIMHFLKSLGKKELSTTLPL